MGRVLPLDTLISFDLSTRWSASNRFLIGSVRNNFCLPPDYNPDYPDYILIILIISWFPRSCVCSPAQLRFSSCTSHFLARVSQRSMKSRLLSVLQKDDCTAHHVNRLPMGVEIKISFSVQDHPRSSRIIQDAPPSTSSPEKCRIWKHFAQTKTVM